MKNENSFYSNSKFYSDKHFPYGIARCGEFTREQADLLERHGKAYEDLHNGKRAPVNPEEIRFVEVCRGNAEPVTEHEHVWMRYCKKIAKKPLASPLCANAIKSKQQIEVDECRLIEDLEDF